MSSLDLAEGTQGSGREVSFSHRDVVPTGWGPVGSGRYGVLLDVTEEPAEAYPGEADTGVQEARTVRVSSPATAARPACRIGVRSVGFPLLRRLVRAPVLGAACGFLYGMVRSCEARAWRGISR